MPLRNGGTDDGLLNRYPWTIGRQRPRGGRQGLPRDVPTRGTGLAGSVCIVSRTSRGVEINVVEGVGDIFDCDVFELGFGG